MDKKVVIALVAILAVAFGFAGYMMGTRSDKAQEQAGGAGIGAGPDAMLAELEKKLAQNPDDWNTMITVADTYFEARRYDKAVELYKKAVKIKPDDVDSYNDIALSSHYLGDSKTGLEFVEQGLKKDPNYQRIWLTKGFILAYGTGEIDGARAAWEKAKQIDPDSQIGKAATDFLAQFKDKK